MPAHCRECNRAAAPSGRASYKPQGRKPREVSLRCELSTSLWGFDQSNRCQIPSLASQSCNEGARSALPRGLPVPRHFSLHVEPGEIPGHGTAVLLRRFSTPTMVDRLCAFERTASCRTSRHWRRPNRMVARQSRGDDHAGTAVRTDEGWSAASVFGSPDGRSSTGTCSNWRTCARCPLLPALASKP